VSSVKTILAGLLAALVISVVHADVIDGFYDVEIAVNDTSTGELNRASALALQRMLIRASGTESVLQNPALQQTLAQASKYIGQYGFDSRGDGGVAAKFNFSPRTIEKLLSDSGEPIWSEDRPDILIWLVLEQAGERRLAVQGDTLFDALLSAGRERGIPIKSPLYDIQDRFAVSADQLWAMERVAIEEASARYQSNAVLVVRAWQDSRQQWLLNWEGFRLDRPLAGSDRCTDISLCFNEPVGVLAERWSDRFGVVLTASTADTVTMTVSDMGFTEYSRLSQYLRELPSVRKATVMQVTGNEYTFAVQLMSDVETFVDLLSLNQDLFAETGSPAPMGLRYKWLR